jgi:DNA polymerase II small subunit
MKRSEIIKKFLSSGYQLDLKSLEFFEKNPEQISEILEKVRQLEISTITFDLIENIMGPIKLKVLKDFSCQERTYAVEDYIKFFNSRYEKLRQIIVKKTDLINLISINKISDKTKKFSLITLVREKNPEERSVTVEDGTGELTVLFHDETDFNSILHDEVVGLVCEKQNDRFYVDKVIFPDVPLSGQIAKSIDEIYCLFISDFHMDSKEFSKKSYEKFLDWIRKVDYKNFFVFILGDISSNKDDLQRFLSDLEKYNKFFLKGEIDSNTTLNNNSLVEIQGVKIFISHGDIFSNYFNMWNGLTPENVLLNLIKKRHINPVFDFSKRAYDEDPYFIDVVPDIFVFGHLHIPGILNYKGITIISNGSFITKPIFWLINLKTRETFKLDFT